MSSHKSPKVFQTAFAIYKCVREVGAGGTSIVYEVRDRDGERFALKCLRPGLDSTKLKRFKNEIAFCSKGTHKNIVKVLDHGVTTDHGQPEPFYVMPFYEATLRDLIHDRIDPSRVLPLYDQVLTGVEAAHLSGVIHRDLKPENILFDPQAQLAVVADFGIAQFKEEVLLTAVETRNQDRLANFVYAAPEQRARGRAVAVPADIFALGLILNVMFTGEVPHGTGFRRIGDVSPDHAYLDEIVENMIRQEPASRPESIRVVKDMLLTRGNEFVELQRLDRLKNEVVPETEIDDPLLRDPVRLTGVDYQNGRLLFRLSTAPNGEWIRAFHNQGGEHFLGWEPRSFQIQRDQLSIHAIPSDHDNQKLIEYTKLYVLGANAAYANFVRTQHQKELNRRRQALQDAVATEERRQRILKGITL